MRLDRVSAARKTGLRHRKKGRGALPRWYVWLKNGKSKVSTTIWHTFLTRLQTRGWEALTDERQPQLSADMDEWSSPVALWDYTGTAIEHNGGASTAAALCCPPRLRNVSLYSKTWQSIYNKREREQLTFLSCFFFYPNCIFFYLFFCDSFAIVIPKVKQQKGKKKTKK